MQELLNNFSEQILALLGIVLGIGAGWRAVAAYFSDDDARLLKAALWFVVAGGFVFANSTIIKLIKDFWNTIS